MDNTVVHFDIPAKDVDKLKSFYEGLFNWKIEKVPGPIDYWLIETVPIDEQGNLIRQGVNGGMYKKEDESQVCVNYITVDDLDASLEKLEELEGSIMIGKQDVPGVGFIAHVRDPEGNSFAMLQPQKISRNLHLYARLILPPRAAFL